MHTFTLSDSGGRHLGFMVFLPDSEHDGGADSGSCMFSLTAADDAVLPQGLEQYAGRSLRWCREGGGFALYGEDGTPLAALDGQYLNLGGLTLILSDLEGNL